MVNQQHVKLIASWMQLGEHQVRNTLSLLDEGATVPFISRYRKEATSSLDEVAIQQIKEHEARLEELDKRRESILKTIEEQGKLTDELRKKIEGCYDLAVLEDIYLPYKPKRKTRASVAREKGLEPLAALIMRQTERNLDEKVAAFINEQVPTADDALQGARDIIAEWVSENQIARESVRNLFARESVLTAKVAKGKEVEAAKYTDYFNYSEPLRKCPSHRYLAIRRGENEGFLKISIEPSEDRAVEMLQKQFVRGFLLVSEQVSIAVEDSYKRLIAPSIETEFRNMSKEKADDEAIRVFSENLRQLLLSSPLGQKRVLGIDPGFRTGCKLVCLDNQGNLLHNETIYPHAPQHEYRQATAKLTALVAQYKIEAIAIGNGTASRETEQVVKNTPFDRAIQVYVVSEAGASVYSASSVAREEFPEYDVTVRGAVSIGRRLMDPLAELVKIDPKSIGVGQYQHDVDQGNLQKGLDTVVESCVNLVGVNVNTASKHILTYISGLNKTLAQNIVDFRRENGPFASRKDLLKVPRMGAKAFEQSAGFLRISGGKNPLDNSAVHPESYHVVEKMATDLSCTVEALLKESQLRQKIDIKRYVTPQIGLPTLTDIVTELAKPGLDPRSQIKVFEFADVHSINDLKIGMTLPGIVTNITNFGAFVDVGVKQDGLVHISQLTNRFISDPNEVVKLHQHVQVKVIEVDIARKRIQLSMKEVSA